MKICTNFFIFLILIFNSFEARSVVAINADEHASNSIGSYHYSNTNDVEVLTNNTVKFQIRGIDIPEGSYVDELYIRLLFDPDYTFKIENLVSVNSCIKNYTDVESDFRYEQNGDYLVLTKNFVDSGGLGVLDPFSSNCWGFAILGEQADVISAEFTVTFHSAERRDTSGEYILPSYNNIDYYTNGLSYAFDGKRSLSVISTNLLELEESSSSEAGGRKVPQGSENLIILIHGWNPNGNKNHYAPINQGSCPSTMMRNDLQCSWKYLYESLNNNLIIKNDWVISRYHWEEDAYTGLIGGGLANDFLKADEARDRAHVHGRRLGKIIEEINPKRVQFIAHSAGNWVARRAADYIKKSYSVEVELVALDPFVKSIDALGFLTLKPDFEVARKWLDSSFNYYAVDGLDSASKTDILNYTSHRFNGWVNVQLDAEINNFFYEVEGFQSFMVDHAGPIFWYAKSVRDGVGSDSDIGFNVSLPYKYSSQNCYTDISNYSEAQKKAICHLQRLGVLTNERDQFYGEEFITREEVLKLVSKVSEIQYGIYNRPVNASAYSGIVDLPTDFWRKYFVEMLDKDVINGEIRNGIRYVTPKRNVSYGEIIKMVVNVFKGDGVIKNGFGEDQAHWGCRYDSCVNQQGNGWTRDQVDVFYRSTPKSACGTTDFDRPVKRHEVAYFVYNALDLWGNLSSDFNPNIGLCLIPNLRY